MGIKTQHNSRRQTVTRTISTLTCIILGVTFTLSDSAHATELAKKFGIGLQGATPAFGGISFRYNGLSPVYLQSVGRFIVNDQNSDHMLGAGISYAIFEHQGRRNLARLYFSLEGGWRYEKEPNRSQENVNTTTLGAGIAFGGELVISFGGIPLGLNAAVGQGFGRENVNSQIKGLAGVYLGTGIHAYF